MTFNFNLKKAIVSAMAVSAASLSAHGLQLQAGDETQMQVTVRRLDYPRYGDPEYSMYDLTVDQNATANEVLREAKIVDTHYLSKGGKYFPGDVKLIASDAGFKTAPIPGRTVLQLVDSEEQPVIVVALEKSRLRDRQTYTTIEQTFYKAT